MKSREDVEILKEQWCNDPCWDIYCTEGFEEYKEELERYQEIKEHQWMDEQIKREEEIDVMADSLGVHGLYRLILQQQKTIEELRQ